MIEPTPGDTGAAPRPLDPAATQRANRQAQMCLEKAGKMLDGCRPRDALTLAECAVTWIKATLPDEAST